MIPIHDNSDAQWTVDVFDLDGPDVRYIFDHI